MKQILPVVFCFYLFVTCSNKLISPVRNNYKGDKLFKQPPLAVFPEAGYYTYTKLSDTSLSNALCIKLKQILYSQKIVGLTASAILPAKGIWQLDTGYISKNNHIPVDSTTVFYWASVGKLITSIIIHQLIIENKISLGDKLQKWYPRFEYADKITISQLLNHTSGIYSFNNDSAFHYSNQYHTPDQLLEIALKKNNLFEPGQYWSYTNTGYLLLALIAEKVEARDFSEIVDRKLSIPYQLNSLKALRPYERPENLALSHKHGADAETHFSTPLGAGNIISNSRDMAVLLSLLLTGELLPIQIVHRMFSRLYPMFQNKGQYYGLGVMLYNFNEINNVSNQWIGHSGGTENYKSVLVYDFMTQSVIAVSISSNVSAEAVAGSMFAVIKKYAR